MIALLITTLAVIATTALVVVRRTMVAVTVYGRSMAPTYVEGDVVLVRRTRLAKLRRGEVVVVGRPPPNGPAQSSRDADRGHPHRWVIKRIVALPGDPVPIEAVPLLAGRAEATVPAGSLVLLGDNRSASYDSRQIGYLPGESILGTAVRTLKRTSGPRLTPTPPELSDGAPAHQAANRGLDRSPRPGLSGIGRAGPGSSAATTAAPR